MTSQQKVAVALSGGIDSAVTAALLIEQGYEVIGITANMLCNSESAQIIENAKKVAVKLGIEHHILDVSEIFSKKIVKYFEDSYKKGETPNPCIMCNKYIKWGSLFDYAITVLNCDYIATGHYANIKENQGEFRLYPASDEHKDQLYFLFLLDQKMLSRTLFPLSNYKKDEVRALAEKYDLPPKSAKESQDICFIKPPLTTKKYLNSIFKPKQGDFIELSTGKVLGKHEGFWQYTIGQRKGIGIAAPEPLYVVSIDSTKNIVYISYQRDLYKEELQLEDFIWTVSPQGNDFEALVKIRYNMQAVKARVIIENGNKIRIKFNEPVSAIAPGQACVLYDFKEGYLLGGNFINL